MEIGDFITWKYDITNKKTIYVIKEHILGKNIRIGRVFPHIEIIHDFFPLVNFQKANSRENHIAKLCVFGNYY